MPVGSIGDLAFLEPLGFPVVEKCTILGMVIDNNLDFLEDNFEKVIEKMVKTVNFWHRFHLSLPGRIAIGKTFLLSLFLASTFICAGFKAYSPLCRCHANVSMGLGGKQSLMCMEKQRI